MNSFATRALVRLAALALLCLAALPAALSTPPAHAANVARAVSAIDLSNGALIRDTSNGRAYVIWAGRRHWFSTGAVFNVLGYSGQAIQNLDHTVVATIPEGNALSLATTSNGLTLPWAPVVADPVQLDLSTPSASPGGSIQLRGSGFAPGETVTLTEPNLTFTISADGNGRFTVNLPILGNVDLGLHRVYAQGVQSGLFGVQVFQVITQPTQPPAVVVAPGTVAQGQPIAVSGSGFAPGETVEVFVAGGAVAAMTTATANGSFGPLPLPIPASVGTGGHSVRAYGTSSFRYAESGVTVVPAQQATPTATPTPLPSPTPVLNPAISLNPASLSPGAQTVVSGSGFFPGETVLIRFNGNLQNGVTTSAAGDFSGVLVSVPVGTAAGTYAITASGASSGRSVGASLVVQPAQPGGPPSIAVSPTSAQPGTQIHVAGTGFQPGETVLVSFNNAVVQNLTADATGSFTNGAFVVPTGLTPGQYGVAVLGAVSGRAANAVLAVVAPPSVPVARIFANPLVVNPSGRLNLGGSGFAARETVLIRVDGALALALTADGAGSFSAGFTIRLGLGQHILSATGASSGRSASVAIRVAQPVTPGIGLEPNRVHRGAVVAVNGNNFLPNEIVLIRFRGALVQAVQADASGRFFHAHFTVPGSAPYGVSAVTITGARSGRSATAGLAVIPAPPAGPRVHLAKGGLHHGDAETVSGSGYLPGEVVLIRFRGALVQAAMADARGNFSRAGFRIPVNSPFGKQTITATGTRSGRSAMATVTITPRQPSTSITVSPAIVRHNGVVTVTGQGFEGGEIVLIRVRNVLVQAATANGQGRFRLAFRLPGGNFKGADVLLATGARSKRHAQVTLVVI